MIKRELCKQKVGMLSSSVGLWDLGPLGVSTRLCPHLSMHFDYCSELPRLGQAGIKDENRTA
jgi:hypothetical protein